MASSIELVRICKATHHGTTYAYSRKKCRCPDAVAAKAAEFAAWKERKRNNSGPVLLDDTGVRRMIYALRAAGWTDRQLAERLGYKHTTQLTNLLRGQRVHPSTLAKISALYGALENVPGPSQRNRARGQRDGWVVPWAWDDITTDEAPYEEYRGRQPNGHMRRVGQGRKNRPARELVYEYQVIRESGMGHEFALKELGVTHDALMVAMKRAEGR